MINDRIRQLIAKRFGRELRYSQECDALSEDIFERTGERLGISTLKRMLGFTGASVVPRTSTMDIIAQYLGYSCYSELAMELGEGVKVSDFDTIDGIDPVTLTPGTHVMLTYSPDRKIVMRYIGEGWFTVIESENSKLLKGDRLKLSNLSLGFELIVSEVIRNGCSLGAYRAAKNSGIKTLDIIDPSSD